MADDWWTIWENSRPTHLNPGEAGTKSNHILITPIPYCIPHSQYRIKSYSTRQPIYLDIKSCMPYHTAIIKTYLYVGWYNSAPYHDINIPYRTIPYHTIPYHTILHHITPTIMHRTILYHIQNYNILHNRDHPSIPNPTKVYLKRTTLRLVASDRASSSRVLLRRPPKRSINWTTATWKCASCGGGGRSHYNKS